jgi:3-hydroxyisobutyrate dehydrogenase-like beta-hydroxyacid dehydrogenase
MPTTVEDAVVVTIGVVSPGAMGGALGRGWAEAGARVVATVAGRSARTGELAHGIELLPSLRDVVAAADVVVSVVPPGEALDVATAVREAAEVSGARPLVADLNAVSPATMRLVAEALGPLDLVDGSISGGPPDTGTTRVYLAGPRAADIVALGHPQLDVLVLPGPVGTASAVKMSTASVYKGFSALLLHAVAAAEVNGVRDVVLDDLAREFPDVVADLAPWLASSAAKAHRYAGEMREIAAAQASAGLPGELFAAMALVWERVAATPLGRQTPEEARAMTDVAEVVRLLGG